MFATQNNKSRILGVCVCGGGGGGGKGEGVLKITFKKKFFFFILGKK